MCHSHGTWDWMKEHISPVPDGQPWKRTYVEHFTILQTEYMCVCVLIINDKGIHKFKRSQGGIFERMWRQENERENAVIIL